MPLSADWRAGETKQDQEAAYLKVRENLHNLARRFLAFNLGSLPAAAIMSRQGQNTSDGFDQYAPACDHTGQRATSEYVPSLRPLRPLRSGSR